MRKTTKKTPRQPRGRQREFSVVIEQDAEGFYIGSVPGLLGCHTQARSLDKLMKRMREVIGLCLEVQTNKHMPEFIGVQRIAIGR